MAEKPVNDRIIRDIAELKHTTQTLVMATADKEGTPNVSVAPFVIVNDAYYIFISSVARHYKNLTDTKKVSIMMVQDEAHSRIMYARMRLTFDAQAFLVPDDTEEFKEGIKALRERHGKVVEDLVSMKDFELFRLVPQAGLFVKGFGKAWEISADALVEPAHLTIGHQFDQREVPENFSGSKE